SFGTSRRRLCPTLFPYTTLFRSHLAEEVSGIEVGDDHFATVVVLDEDGDRPLDDEEQGVAAITGVDDGALGGDRCETLFFIIKGDRKSTRLNSSHVKISYAVFCL